MSSITGSIAEMHVLYYPGGTVMHIFASARLICIKILQALRSCISAILPVILLTTHMICCIHYACHECLLHVFQSLCLSLTITDLSGPGIKENSQLKNILKPQKKKL